MGGRKKKKEVRKEKKWLQNKTRRNKEARNKREKRKKGKRTFDIHKIEKIFLCPTFLFFGIAEHQCHQKAGLLLKTMNLQDKGLS